MSFYVSKTLSLSHTSLKDTENLNTSLRNDIEPPTLGAVIPNSDYVWVAKGPHLEVISSLSGNKVGAWTFGGNPRDYAAQISCVDKIERPHGKLPLLLVAVNYLNDGQICIFDPAASKVIRSIQIQEKVTSIHVIDSECEMSTIPGPLRIFDGIISVGTGCGNVYLVDMCLQACEEDILNIDIARIRDESYPCQMAVVTFVEIARIEQLKTKSVRRGEHLGIHLNAVLDKTTQHFVLKGQNGEDRIHVNKDEVAVSAIHFCPQLASLLVGYNFGAFQLWNLVTLELVYTSPVCDDHIPVTNFAVQEPVDDPRAYCYVWASYSPEVLYQKGFPYAVMYALCYSSKEHLEDYGIVYQGFQTTVIRFQMELNIFDDKRTISKPRGGQCLRLLSVNRGTINRESQGEGNEDVLALCLAVWTIWCSESEIYTYASVFDLNQWYKEQMPGTPNFDLCSNYLLHVCITDLVNSRSTEVEPLLDAYLPKKSLNQFIGTQRLEEHFYPTSLIFDLCCLSEGNITIIHNQGLQKAVLTQIESAGPLCLIKPTDFYNQIITIGLTPLFVDVPLYPREESLEFQRRLILDVALEQQLVGWLCKCASEWANGSFMSVGCSLDLILSWATDRLITLKTNCDKYCVPLFDYSETKVDSNTNKLINSCTRQIKNLSSVYAFIMAKLSRFLPNPDFVQEQSLLVHMLSIYFEVLQWLLNMGFLPECPLMAYPRTEDKDKIAVPYAYEKLASYFLERRISLKQLNKDRFSTDQSLLFIDNLIELEPGGSILQQEWQKDGGSGFYPPTSLQALMRTYLVERMLPVHKHMIASYLFLDVAMSLNHKRYEHVIPQLIKFPTVFKVSLSTVKLTQAFWELDHGGFISAIEQLLDPLIMMEDFKPWHHKVALRSFLLQDQPNFALLYLQVRKPTVLDEEDILTTISLYVANKMVDEAFYFQKKYRTDANEEALLLHLFSECKNYDNMNIILNRTMTPVEEAILLKFFQKCGNTNMQVTYYIMRSRYLEAFNKHGEGLEQRPEQLGLVGQMNATSIDYLINCFRNTLPEVSSNVVNLCRKEKTRLWKEVARPTPMSVFVNNPSEKVCYKSTVMQAALAKAKRTFSDSVCEKFLTERDLVSEETPFLRTPTATLSHKRKATPVITPKIIDIDSELMDHGPSPKKLKLSPISPSQSLKAKLDTPLIRRKTSPGLGNASNVSGADGFTPYSILKVRDKAGGQKARENSLEITYMNESPLKIYRNHSVVDDDTENDTSLNSSLRESISRKSRLAVHFEDSSRRTSYNKKPRVTESPSLLHLRNSGGVSGRKSILEVPLLELNTDSSKSTSEDIFYSPETSFPDITKDSSKDITATETDDKTTDDHHENNVLTENVIMDVENGRRDASKSHSEEPISNSRYSRDVKTPDREEGVRQSPRSRRSYKAATPPMRSSPRLARNSSDQDVSQEKVETNVPAVTKSEPSVVPSVSNTPSPKITRRVQARKSLSRQVLENNAINRLIASPSVTDDFKGRLSSVQFTYSKTTTNTVTTETSTSKEETSSHSEVKYEDTYSKDRQSGEYKHEHSTDEVNQSRKYSEMSLSETTAGDSDFSLNLSENKYDGPQLSDSLWEFMTQSKTGKKPVSGRRSSNSRLNNISQSKEYTSADDSFVSSKNNSANITNSNLSQVQHDANNTLSEKNISLHDTANKSDKELNADARFSTSISNFEKESHSHKTEKSNVVNNANSVFDKNVSEVSTRESESTKTDRITRTSFANKSTNNSKTFNEESDISISLYEQSYDGPQLSDSLMNYMRESQTKKAENFRQSKEMNNQSSCEEETDEKNVEETSRRTGEGVSEVMEVDDEDNADVNVYEGLSSDEEDQGQKQKDDVYGECHVHTGNPGMNLFEYSPDLPNNENTQMTKEYICDYSSVNVLDRNVLDENNQIGENVYNASKSQSSQITKSDNQDSSRSTPTELEKAFIHSSRSSSPQSGKTSGSSHSAQNNSKRQNIVSDVIEIDSSSSDGSTKSSQSSNQTDTLNTSYEENIEHRYSSSPTNSNSPDYSEDSNDCMEKSDYYEDESDLEKDEPQTNPNEIINLDDESDEENSDQLADLAERNDPLSVEVNEEKSPVTSAKEEAEVVEIDVQEIVYKAADVDQTSPVEHTVDMVVAEAIAEDGAQGINSQNMEVVEIIGSEKTEKSADPPSKEATDLQIEEASAVIESPNRTATVTVIENQEIVIVSKADPEVDSDSEIAPVSEIHSSIHVTEEIIYSQNDEAKGDSTEIIMDTEGQNENSPSENMEVQGEASDEYKTETGKIQEDAVKDSSKELQAVEVQHTNVQVLKEVKNVDSSVIEDDVFSSDKTKAKVDDQDIDMVEESRADSRKHSKVHHSKSEEHMEMKDEKPAGKSITDTNDEHKLPKKRNRATSQNAENMKEEAPHAKRSDENNKSSKLKRAFERDILEDMESTPIKSTTNDARIDIMERLDGTPAYGKLKSGDILESSDLGKTVVEGSLTPRDTKNHAGKPHTKSKNDNKVSKKQSVTSKKTEDNQEADTSTILPEKSVESPKTKRIFERDILEDMESTPVKLTSNEAHVDIMERVVSTPYSKMKPSDILESSDLGKTMMEEVLTPTRRKRSSSRLSDSRLSLPLRRSRRLSASSRNEDDMDVSKSEDQRFSHSHVGEANSSYLDDSNLTEKGVAGKRVLRSRSVDIELPPADKAETSFSKTRSRAGSVSKLAPIKEDVKSVAQPKRNTRAKSVSTMDDYSSSRRLTRRQADLMQKTINAHSSSAKTVEEEDVPVLEEIDPIQLLHKENFEGNPDPEEAKLFETSPTTSIETGSVQTGRRTRRSTSVVSDNSEPESHASTPKRKRNVTPADKKTTSQSNNAVSAGVRTRSRTSSIDEIPNTPEQADASSPPKRTRKNSEASNKSESEASTSARSTRSRAKSVSSVASDSSKLSTRSRRRLVSAKSDLPEIREER